MHNDHFVGRAGRNSDGIEFPAVRAASHDAASHAARAYRAAADFDRSLADAAAAERIS